MLNTEQINQVRNVVDLLRKNFPIFDINNVIEDIEEVIENFGVKVFYSTMEGFDTPRDISGYSRVNDLGKPEIIVNINDSDKRQRFTMAHELGHIILHWNWLNMKNQQLSKDNIEILFRSNHFYNPEEQLKELQANEFAAELLIPMNTLKTSISTDYQLLLTDMFIRDQIKFRIASAYNVSESFAGIQLNKAIKEISSNEEKSNVR